MEDFVTVQIIYMHKQIYYTLKEKENIKKHHMIPLKFMAMVHFASSLLHMFHT